MATVVGGGRTILAPPKYGIGEALSGIGALVGKYRSRKAIQDASSKFLDKDLPDIQGFVNATAGRVPIEQITAIAALARPKVDRAIAAQRAAVEMEERQQRARNLIRASVSQGLLKDTSELGDIKSPETATSLVGAVGDRREAEIRADAGKYAADSSMQGRLAAASIQADTARAKADKSEGEASALISAAEKSGLFSEGILSKEMGSDNIKYLIDVKRAEVESSLAGGKGSPSQYDQQITALAKALNLDPEKEEDRNIAINYKDARSAISKRVTEQFTQKNLAGVATFLGEDNVLLRNLTTSVAERRYLAAQKRGEKITVTDVVNYATDAVTNGTMVDVPTMSRALGVPQADLEVDHFGLNRRKVGDLHIEYLTKYFDISEEAAIKYLKYLQEKQRGS